MYEIIQGDCIEKMQDIPENSIEAVITDPPYELGFMSKDWDGSGIAFNVAVWKECLRVLKPGGYLFSAGIGRTHHRMMCAVEDAGFEIRECVYHIFGSGFPKSRDIGKDVDRLLGNDREVVGKMSDIHPRYKLPRNPKGVEGYGNIISSNGDMPLTKGNSAWEGWGSNLKPAVEIWVMARKPLSEKTIAKNCLKWGTGAINIDASRVGTTGGTAKGTFPNEDSNGIYGNGLNGACEIKDIGKGRFPANLILSADENGQVHEEVRECFPDTKSGKAGFHSRKGGNVYGGNALLSS